MPSKMRHLLIEKYNITTTTMTVEITKLHERQYSKSNDTENVDTSHTVLIYKLCIQM